MAAASGAGGRGAGSLRPCRRVSRLLSGWAVRCPAQACRDGFALDVVKATARTLEKTCGRAPVPPPGIPDCALWRGFARPENRAWVETGPDRIMTRRARTMRVPTERRTDGGAERQGAAIVRLAALAGLPGPGSSSCRPAWTGTGPKGSSPAPATGPGRPSRAMRRQPLNCVRERPRRRATPATVAPSSKVSVTIRALTASGRTRAPLAPVATAIVAPVALSVTPSCTVSVIRRLRDRRGVRCTAQVRISTKVQARRFPFTVRPSTCGGPPPARPCIDSGAAPALRSNHPRGSEGRRSS